MLPVFVTPIVPKRTVHSVLVLDGGLYADIIENARSAFLPSSENVFNGVHCVFVAGNSMTEPRVKFLKGRSAYVEPITLAPSMVGVWIGQVSYKMKELVVAVIEVAC